MFASNIGTEHFVGQAGSAAAGGLAVGLYEWLSVYNILLLAFVFAPLYLNLDLTTVSQYVGDRYDQRCRVGVTLICLIAYVTTKISATLMTGVFLVKVIYGGDVNVYLVSVVLVLITACYTIAGGLKAVMVTDAVQLIIFMVGGLLGLQVALSRVSLAEMQALLPDDFFHVVRTKGEYAWTGMFFGQPITSCWYWCIDQFISQRVLSARSLPHGQSGCLLAGCMKFLPPFMLCFPGMVARALYERCRRNHLDTSNPWCSTHLDEPRYANLAYPLLVVYEFPSGLRGLIVAAMFMAMLSSLSSVYNSSATLITIDLYQGLYKPDATETQLVSCGRASALLMTVLTFCWFPVLNGQNGLIYLFGQNVMSHLFPTLVVVFLLGVITTSANTQGALAGVATGTILGMAQLVVSLGFEGSRCSESFFSWGCMHFNHFAIWLAIVVAVVTLFVSRWYPPPDADQLAGRTIWSQSRHGQSETYDDLDAPSNDTPKVRAETQSSGLRASAAADNLPPTTLGHECDTAQGPPLADFGSKPHKMADASGDATAHSGIDLNVGDECEEKATFGMHGLINKCLGFVLAVLMALNIYFWA